MLRKNLAKYPDMTLDIIQSSKDHIKETNETLAVAYEITYKLLGTDMQLDFKSYMGIWYASNWGVSRAKNKNFLKKVVRYLSET